MGSTGRFLQSLWQNTATALTLPAKVTRHVASSPPVLFGVGNTIRAWQLAEPIGIAVNGIATLVTIGLSAHEAITGKPQGLPYFALGAVNGITAASILWNGIEQQGVNGLFAFREEAKTIIFTTASYAFWCAGSFCGGFHDARKSRPKYVVDDIQVHYGMGDLSSVQFNPLASIPLTLGLVKSFLPTPQQEANSNWTFLNKHISPARLYSVGFFIGAACNVVSDPVFAIVQTLWGGGYIGMDKTANADFRNDVRNIYLNSRPEPK